jgi:hypothetical protein
VRPPPISLAPWPIGPEHPCAGCGEFVRGIPIGGLCADCTRVRKRRAARIARWVAMGTTLPLAGYVAWTLPRDPSARLVGAVVVVIWYGLTSLIARRVAWEWIK